MDGIASSRECVKLADLVPWQKTLEIADYSLARVTQVTKVTLSGRQDTSTESMTNDNVEKNNDNAESQRRQGSADTEQGYGAILDEDKSIIAAPGSGRNVVEMMATYHKRSNGNLNNAATAQKELLMVGGEGDEISENAEEATNMFLKGGSSQVGTFDHDRSKNMEAAKNSISNKKDTNTELQFPFRESLNSKIYLWNGDITKLSVQAVILPVYEVVRECSYLYANLMHSAGPRLLQDCEDLTGLLTGEVRVHHGYDLPARYAVHVVEPKYNPIYQSAADTSLHICYRSALQVCVEKRIRTVAISPLHISRRGFPLKLGSKVALRTIRKCLEVLETKFDAVVIVTDPMVANAYSKLFPAYFPRSEAESRGKSRLLLDNICCNEWGESLQQERAIRIADISELELRNSEVEEQSSKVTDKEEATIDQTMGPHAFSQMSGDHDKKRTVMLASTMSQQTFQAQERIYKRLVRLARNENFSQFSALRAVKVSGHDVTANRVVSIIGRLLVFSEIDLEKFLLYLIMTFDPIVDEPYTIVYFHTETLDFNRPSTEYLRKLYSTFDQRYRSNLARLCIVHMNRLTRLRTWFRMSFSASEVRDRTVNVRTIPELYKIVAPNQIDVPPFVLSYDMRMNPQAYNTSPRRNHTGKRPQRDYEPNL